MINTMTVKDFINNIYDSLNFSFCNADTINMATIISLSKGKLTLEEFRIIHSNLPAFSHKLKELLKISSNDELVKSLKSGINLTWKSN